MSGEGQHAERQGGPRQLSTSSCCCSSGFSCAGGQRTPANSTDHESPPCLIDAQLHAD
uniref:Uncharacterized protein n=1 Tax=Arundo donax TaxID=35708 RepID=A0A0A9A384_ARUDO